MVRKAITGTGALVAALTFTGCNGNNGYFHPGQCNPPNGIGTALVYPAPNASGIPDTFGVVILGSSAPLPGSFQAVVVNDTTQNAVAFNVLGVAPSPLPTPDAVPAIAHPVYQSSGNPGVSFVPGSTLTVYLNDANSNCRATYALGSFRVQ